MNVYIKQTFFHDAIKIHISASYLTGRIFFFTHTDFHDINRSSRSRGYIFISRNNRGAYAIKIQQYIPSVFLRFSARMHKASVKVYAIVINCNR